MPLLRDAAGRLTRTQALAGVALVSVGVLVSAYWNVARLAILRDHPVPGWVFWPATWLLLGTAVTLLMPAERRTRTVTALTFGVTAVVVAFAAGIALVAGVLSDSSSRRGELVDTAVSADGRYQVRIRHWQAMLGEDGWDVVVQRRDGPGTTERFAGCLFAESSGDYERVRSVEPGTVRIATERGPISIAFDPATMAVTKRIPADLCAGYG
ncbi:hypothetical protein [Actinoplanes sp. URMC 104]|uniref:hypothetical protein n=1 Tax=Actinoplanes sp. URMC 104 TaxID=3423409 RepID=UPI003F1C18B1